MRHERRSVADRDRGAAAVEFALVAPLLFLLLFGTLAYGIYFTDSLALRDGVRSTARAGSLRQWGSSGSSCPSGWTAAGSGAGAAGIRRLGCTALADLGVIGGSAAIRIEVYDPSGNPTGTWQQGGSVKVCAAVQQAVIVPFVPLPGGGLKHASVQMPIENDDPSVDNFGGSTPPVPGDNWSWC